MSYEVLLRRARGLLSRFQQHGLEPGDPVLLFVRNNMAFVDAFWACQLGGLVPVPLSAGVQGEYLHKLVAVARKFARPFLFTERDLLQRLRKWLAGADPFVGGIWQLEEIDRLDGEGELYRAAPQDTALIQFSSGSTSEPKGVLLTHTNLLVNMQAISGAAGIGEQDATLSWMPLSHDMGLIGFHLVPLFTGIEQVLMDTDLFMRRPARWLEAAQRFRSSLLCSPNFGYQHYMKSVLTLSENLDLSHVRLVFNGAEPVSAEVCRAFIQRLSSAGLRPTVFYPVYGLAEASLAVTFPEPGSGVRSVRVAADKLSIGDVVTAETRTAHALELVCLGHPVDGCELRICDQNGSNLPEYAVGHVQIRGANVTSGYYQCPQCEDKAYVDGWLDTGDLGFMSACGLIISGRHKEVLFVNGQTWYPQDIESLLQEGTGMGAAKFAVGALRSDTNAEDLLLIFVQFRRDTAAFVEPMRRVRRALTENTGLHAHAVIPVNHLPRTTSGKLQRYRLVENFEKGEYAEALTSLQEAAQSSGSAPAGAATARQLLDVCELLFPERLVEPDQNLFELGADSLILAQIHEEIEARFPGQVEITDLFKYPSVRELAAYIERGAKLSHRGRVSAGRAKNKGAIERS